MNKSPLDLWHACIKQRSPAHLEELLAEEVVFHSPVVHTPQRGKGVTTLYLTGALHVLVNDSFHYTKQVVGEQVAVLEFETLIDGVTVNGVDIITWNEQGKLIEFKVMVRPLKAINLLHQRMAAMLEAMR